MLRANKTSHNISPHAFTHYAIAQMQHYITRYCAITTSNNSFLCCHDFNVSRCAMACCVTARWRFVQNCFNVAAHCVKLCRRNDMLCEVAISRWRVLRPAVINLPHRVSCSSGQIESLFYTN